MLTFGRVYLYMDEHNILIKHMSINKVKPEEIEQFISKFRTPETAKVFTEGGCYWFAHILYTRFTMTHRHPEIWYNEASNRFATMIAGRLYDITGEIKEVNGDWVKWDSYLINKPSCSIAIFKDHILKN